MANENSRKLYIKREETDMHGYTRGCLGCGSIAARRQRAAHSQECRDRMTRELEKVEGGLKRIRASLGRENDFLGKQLQKSGAEDKASSCSRISQQTTLAQPS